MVRAMVRHRSKLGLGAGLGFITLPTAVACLEKTGGGAQSNFPTLDHQVGYLKIPIYIFWKIFEGPRPPRPLWLCFQQSVIMWLFGATYSSITYIFF